MKSLILPPDFVFPNYTGKGFANIPATILSFFGADTNKPSLDKQLFPLEKLQGIKNIVLILLDGFGYLQWKRYAKDYRLISLIERKAPARQLTSVFPSTTAAALTTINTGLTPQEHGLFEWNVYFPELDAIITTLPFHRIADDKPDQLLEEEISPSLLYRGKTIYQRLQEKQVKTFVMNHSGYVDSAYSRVIHRGATRLPFKSGAELSVNLRRLLEQVSGKTYAYVYWDGIDSAEHKHGPGTDYHAAEIELVTHMLETVFVRQLSPTVARQTLLIFTADHGQVNMDPQETVYLNRFQSVMKAFSLGPNGKSILPAGGPRDVFLHIDSRKLNRVEKVISRLFQNKAAVIKTNLAINSGLFGNGTVSRRFKQRVGNLMILPHRNHTIWYRHPKTKKTKHFGHHGGLTPEEMLIPLAAIRASDLVF